MPTMSSTYPIDARSRLRLARRRVAALLAVVCAVVLAALAPAGAAGAAASELVIEGAGEGHGVGMSQEGALGFAEHGYSYTAILAHYYVGTSIGTVSSKTQIRVLVGKKVKTLPIESYVRGVIANEMPSNWPAAALQAQAVATRTYALTAHAGGARFNVYSDTRSQVYRGKASETAATNAAAATTAGQIVTYQGQPAITYFFSASGGATEDVQDAFPGSAPEPWLVGVADPFEQGPGHSWSKTMPFSTVARDLHGLVLGTFEGIEVLTRGASPRILSAAVLGSGGTTNTTGDQLAARLGLDDSWAYFSVRTAQGTTAELDLSGRHWTPATPVAPTEAGGAGGTAPAATSSPEAPAPSVSGAGGTAAG